MVKDVRYLAIWSVQIVLGTWRGQQPQASPAWRTQLWYFKAHAPHHGFQAGVSIIRISAKKVCVSCIPRKRRRHRNSTHDVVFGHSRLIPILLRSFDGSRVRSAASLIGVLPNKGFLLGVRPGGRKPRPRCPSECQCLWERHRMHKVNGTIE